MVSYKYDALGRRIERNITNGEVQKFVYDGEDVIEDLDGDENVVTTYLNGPGIDNKIRQTDANGNLYYVSDHLGSTTALTDQNGNVIEQQTYDSFGNGTGSSLTRYTYTGREFDADTGLYYYRARWYDPQVGRFISEDPIGLFGGINSYTYVENDPIANVDPEGLKGSWLARHSVSLKKDPREWLHEFLNRRRRFDGEQGHATQLANRCRELEKWLLALTWVSSSEANLHRELLKQYDWCRRRFPDTCNDPSMNPKRAPDEAPTLAPSQNR